jgi:hypothetical protein
MTSTTFLSSLSLGTLGIGLLIVAIAFAYFLRRRSNRQGMAGRKHRNIARDLDAGNSPPDHSRPK